MLAAAFVYQRIKYKQSSSFWLFRFIDDNGFRALTTNVFSLWIPVCTIYTVMEMVSCIWQLNHHVYVRMSKVWCNCEAERLAYQTWRRQHWLSGVLSLRANGTTIPSLGRCLRVSPVTLAKKPSLTVRHMGSIIFSGFRVWSLDRSRDGRKASVTLNTYFYHLASFILPTLFFGAVLTIT